MKARRPAKAPNPRRRGQVIVARERSAEPRLPHERDESADSQVPASAQHRDIGRKALDDIEAGRVDTDVGPVLEELFRSALQRSAEPVARKRRRPR